MERVIIIGGGILGASAAYHLAKLDVEVLLIDRHDRGQATDAAAGIICPWLSQRRNKPWYALAKAGASYYPQLIQQLTEDGETETGYRKVGAVSLHTDIGKLKKIKERALERRKDAPEIGEVALLNESETQAKFPLLVQQYSSVQVKGAARVDGRALRDALLNGAKKYGAEIIQGDAKLLMEENKIEGVCVNGTVYLTEKIIIAAGAWAPELFSSFGLDVHVKAQKAQILHFREDSKDTSKWPVVIPPNDQYILAFDDGKIVAGATHEDDKGFDVRPTVSGIHEVLDKALEIAPGLSEAAVEEIRIGLRPFTPGFLPIFGPVPEYPRILFANGLGASGLTVGPFIGRQLAHIIVGLPTDIDIANYKVDESFSKSVE